MATKDVNIRINVDDLASRKIKNVGSNIQGVGSAGNVAARGITKMLGPLAAAIASFAALKTAISGVGSAIKLFAGFDDTMRKVQAVTKATDSELAAMTKTAKQLGATTRYTATQSAEALTFLGMAGFSASEAISALPNVLNLAAAGGLELGTAADIATNVLSGFGLEVEQLSRVNDVLAEAFTGSNTTLTELGEGFKYVGPIAKGVGADFEDLIAAMGKLGDAGIKGCYDDKTDVLTIDGWKHWSDVSLEDKFATYCENKNTIEYQKASRLIRYHHKGKMYKVQNREVNLCVTPDHRMFVKPRGKKDFEVLRADEIVGKSVRYLTGGMEREGKTPLLYRVNGFLQDRGDWDKTITAYTGVHGDYSKHDIFEGWIDYCGEVFCAEVPNHLLIVKREGRAIVSGNSLAGTTLRGTIEALFNPTREESKLMEQLSQRIGGAGLQIRNRNGDFVGFANIVAQLEKAGLKGEEALKLFGARAGPGMAALVQVGSEALDEFTNKLNNVDDTTSKIAATQEGGIGGALRGLASAAEGAGIQLGEAFGPKLIGSVNELAEVFRSLTKAIFELDQSGVIGKITASIEGLVKTFSLGVDLGIVNIKSYATAFGFAWDVITGKVDKAKQRIQDFGKTYREIFQKREIIQSDEYIKLDLVDKRIANYQRQIELIQKESQASGRGLTGLQQKIIADAKKKIEELNVVREKLLEDYRNTLDFDIAGEIEKANAKAGKIGTGETTDPATKRLEELAKAESEKRAQNERDRQLANAKELTDLKNQRAEVESQYKLNFLSLDEYYNQRREIIERQSQIEYNVLQEKAKTVTDNTDEAIKIDAKIYANRQKLIRDLTALETEHYSAVVKQEEELLKKQLEANKARRDAEQAVKDIQARVDVGTQGDMEATFMQELADLQQRQNKELEIIGKSKDKEIQLEKYTALQKQEISQLEFDQFKRLLEARLTFAREIASGTSQAFADLYELTGEKQKEFFYLSKAAALAEVAISTSQGIMKAWGQGGLYGAVGAALIAVQGAIQTAKITSTGLAEGGIVPGYSPSNKSDNIPANLTAGEYVQPVDVVKHYGVNAMEAIRQKLIPRDIFSAVNTRIATMPKMNYAEGGPVVKPIDSNGMATTQKDNITIVNYTDRQELLSALSTKDGVNAIVNVISGNREKVSRVLR